MPNYFYKAKNIEGQEESGFLEAADKNQLAKLLKQKGYFLTSAEEKEGGPVVKKQFNLPGLKALENLFGVPLADKLFFTKNLRVMIKTGVSLPRAFAILEGQAKNKIFKKVLGSVSEKITKGESLPQAVSHFPRVFSPLYQETLKVGEETGKLESALGVLANQMEREHALKSKIKTAMVYPSVVLSLAVVIGIVMMVYAVPKLKTAFDELGVALPATTRALLGAADFMVAKWPIALAIIIALVVFMIIALRSEKSGPLKAKVLLKVPLLSKMVRQTNSALALRTLSSLLESGVPIVRSLRVTSGALANFYFKRALQQASEVVEKGDKLSAALKPHQNLFMPMVLQMIEVGEETGETPEVLAKLADFYEEEVAAATQKISSVIEPVLIIIIGGAVGFFALSMMQPMFSIMSGV